MSDTDKLETGTWDPEYQSAQKEAFFNTSLEGGAWHQSGFAVLKDWISAADVKVMEVGCGTAKYTLALAALFPRNAFYALDFLASSVDLVNMGVKLRSLANVSAVKGDILAMPFEKNTFDVLFNEGTLEHFDDCEKYFVKMLEAVKPGGKLIISVPNWLCFPHTAYKALRGKNYENYYEKSFTPWELKALYRKHGLQNVVVSGYFPSYSIMRLSRHFRPLWRLGALLQKLVVEPLDLVTGRAVSRTFGFYVIIKGEKPA